MHDRMLSVADCEHIQLCGRFELSLEKFRDCKEENTLELVKEVLDAENVNARWGERKACLSGSKYVLHMTLPDGVVQQIQRIKGVARLRNLPE